MLLLKLLPTLLILASMLFFSDGGLLVMGNEAAWLYGNAQSTPVPLEIQAPGGGEALQGVVAIHGVSDVPGFRASEVTFAYQNDPTNTWFSLQQSAQPVTEGLLASWDTTTIADGTYQLRLQVVLEDGQVLEHIVAGLRVRNYSRIETSTPPSPAARQATITPSPSPLADFQVLPRSVTPQPTNPAQLNDDDLRRSALRGTLVVFSALLVGVLYLGVRALFRR